MLTLIPQTGPDQRQENLHKENGGVVSDHVPVTLLGVELDGETTGIAGSIGRTLLTSDGRETGEERGALADTVQELGLGELGDVVGNLKVTMGSSSLGVDNTLGDTLTVKVGQLINQSEILKKAAPFAYSHIQIRGEEKKK